MPKVAVYNIDRQQVGDIELNDNVFGVEVNGGLLHQAVVMQLASQRLGTHATKNRAFVRGGGRKPWKQKGTGRARAGYAGAPEWTHGGVAFAPKPRDYSYSLNKKVRKLAMKSALSAKAAENEVLVVDGLKVDEIKTKTFKEFLNKLGISGKALVVTENGDEKVVKSARNIPGVNTTTATILSPYMILTNGVMVVDKAALTKMEEVFA